MPATVLLPIIAELKVADPPFIQTPPPATEAELSVMVELLTVREPPELAIPPPLAAVLFSTVTPSRSRTPLLVMAPPKLLENPLSMLRLLRVREPAAATWKIWLCPSPEIANGVELSAFGRWVFASDLYLARDRRKNTGELDGGRVE